tara:strand:- start:944 stop:1678 length:735 start_codon:yes stop_codon:yes gene_type:complete
MFTHAKTAEERGLEIAQMMKAASEGFVSDSSEMEMVLIDSYGTRVSRKMKGTSLEGLDGEDRAITEFLSPADVKGTKLLTHSHKGKDDDQWLYLPAMKRKKRISGGARSSSFMGSEFSYEDLGSQDIEKFNFRFIADEPVKGGKAWRVERKSKKRSGYSKQIMIVHQEYLSPVTIEYYDRRGGLLKVADFTDWKQMKVGKKSFWKSGNVHVKNIQTKKESIFKWEKRELGKKFDSVIFNPGALR